MAPILNFTESGLFEYNRDVDLSALARDIRANLFGTQAYHVLKGFIGKDVAERLRNFYTKDNSSAFHTNRHPLAPFEAHNYIVYYPRGPFHVPAAMRSLYERISLLRNMAYSAETFYGDYCAKFHLNPLDYESVYAQQVCHTWFRVSWYGNRDGFRPHYDAHGEVAAFVVLTDKGTHWAKGGLHAYDEDDGSPALDLDSLCEVGDLLWLDQHRVIHGVEPICGANPGRLVVYVPINPFTNLDPWFTFENHPWHLHYSSLNTGRRERVIAHLHNMFLNVTRQPRTVPYHRREYPHDRLELA
jgi:hypothetical protein